MNLIDILGEVSHNIEKTTFEYSLQTEKEYIWLVCFDEKTHMKRELKRNFFNRLLV